METAIFSGGTYKAVADRFAVHQTQLWRHLHHYVPRAIEAAERSREALETVDSMSGSNAIEQPGVLKQWVALILADAETEGHRSDIFSPVVRYNI